MKVTFSLLLRLSLGLLLLLGLSLALGMQVRPAHAQSALTVTDCSSDSQLQADVTQANSDNDGDTITFSCSGNIKLTNTLTINGSMTIDGSGQSVTLDGQKSVRVFLVNSGSFTLNALTIANGSSNNGGGIYNGTGTVSISNSTLSNNSTTYNGGGIYNGTGTVSISNSTLSNNSGLGSRGSIFNYCGTVSISNSTLSNSSGYVGSGIDNSGTVSISNSTLSNNSASYGGGIFNEGRVSISGSIVAENPNGDCFTFGSYSSITDKGYNLDSDSSCFTAPTSQHANPQLSALANNGGPTQTMALQQGSPAIDAIPLSTNICPTTDQRGDSRPDDASETTCDIGAYESNYPLTLKGTNVSATEGAAFNGVVATGSYSGSGTLSASIDWGDGTTATTGTVSMNGSNFSVSGSHTYAEEGQYTIKISVSDGQGQNASATDAATVSDAALTLNWFAARQVSHLTAGVATQFTDADPAGTISDYTATVTWGDGTTSTIQVGNNPQGPGFALAGTHRYVSKGTYTVTLTISDQGGSQLTKTVSVTVK